jgi:hypothetical protein
MRKMFLAAGVAALAISAPVASKPGENKGNQGGGQSAEQQEQRGGGGQQARAERGGGGQQARVERRGGGGGQQMRVERGGGQQRQAMRVERQERGPAARSDRGNFMRFAQTERRGPDRARNENRGRQAEARPMRVERQQRVERPQRQEIRGRDRQIERVAANRGRDRNIDRVFVNNGRKADRVLGETVLRVRGDNDRVRVRDFDRFQARYADNRVLGLIDGCPPGLAKKNNGCMPPGLARQQIGTVIPTALRSSLLPLSLRDYWRDDDDYYYRYDYDDGYLYRVNRDNNLIASLLPLFGGGYTLGQSFPYQSSSYFMPSYYQPFYQDSADSWYRYNDGYVYAIDPYTGMIDNIIPTYDYGYGVGQMLPTSYSYYNLPYPYRSYYTDNDDYYYRYAPGAIYQVDRDSQLISAVVSLLTGGFGVGQQLPMGYDAYNVPYAYRSQYYDTPDNWYRYNNGYIYQVDPTSRLITAVIDAIV